MKRNILKMIGQCVRPLSQIIFFILSPGLFSSAFSAVKTVASQIAKRQPLEMSTAILTLLLLLAFTFVFGRFFCGMVCSFGALGDLVFSLGEAVRKKFKIGRIKLSKRGEYILSYLKYIILLSIVVLSYLQMQRQLHGKSPWDAFATLISGSPRFKGYEVGFVILFFLIIGMGLIPRFFCRFFCPLGAIFAILPPPLIPLKKPAKASLIHRACGGCQICTKACPAGLDLNKIESPMDVVRSGECFRCMKCAEVCPQKKPALNLLVFRLPLIPAIVLILLLFIILLIVFGLI